MKKASKSKPVKPSPKLRAFVTTVYPIVSALVRAHANNDADGIQHMFVRALEKLPRGDRKRFEGQLVAGAIAFLDARDLERLRDAADGCINSLHEETHDEPKAVKRYLDELAAAATGTKASAL